MQPSPPAPQPASVPIADYDEDDYDYRQFWRGRDYEQWAEARVIRRALARLPRAPWLIDLGGGFGRHIPRYRAHADHVVLLDYSRTNLGHAAEALLRDGQPEAGLFLVRGNLYHLPFQTAAFDLGMTTRVIHHLQAIDAALDEMGRVLAAHWMLDVPITAHLLARARALARGDLASLRARAPHRVGTPETPFYNFHLGAVRARLAAAGWRSSILASVNNFRRWERVVPGPLVAPARPLVRSAEVAAQRVGRGWWGPAQFLWLTRQPPYAPGRVAAVRGVPPAPWDALAPLMRCPRCGGDLEWSAGEARCAACDSAYARSGPIWDFAVE